MYSEPNLLHRGDTNEFVEICIHHITEKPGATERELHQRISFTSHVTKQMLKITMENEEI